MSINDITLAGGMRSNLTNLQMVSALQNRTTLRLSTGKRVNSATDDAAAYFAAQQHNGRANDLSSLKAAMGEALQAVKAGSTGIDGITKLIEQAKGLTTAARSASTADRATLATQFGDLLDQIDQLAGDASYKGTNFLAGDTLTVQFNEAATSTLDIVGTASDSAGLGIGAAANAWAGDADIAAAATDLDAALTTLRTTAKTLASNSGVVAARQDFTSGLIATLTEGADQLTSADPNEESANMLALQTRQQLGVVALQLTSQAQQSILRLF